MLGTDIFIERTKTEYMGILNKVNREGIEDLKEFLSNSSFFTCPASQYSHANYPGGLAWHSVNLTKIALSLNKMYKTNISEESIIIAGLCHDLCKIDNYSIIDKWKKDDKGKWVSYKTYGNKNIPMCQHGPQSALMAARYIKLKEIEEQAICWHMGAYGQSDSENKAMSNATKTNPLILLIQQADMASAFIYEDTFPADEIPGLK